VLIVAEIRVKERGGRRGIKSRLVINILKLE
jgi:hypothetical protein